MARRRLTIVSGLLVCAVLVMSIVYLVVWKGSPVVETDPPVTKVLRFSYTLTNQSSDFIESAEFVTHIPAEIDGSQTIESIEASHDYHLVDNGGIHRSMKFNINNLPPYGSRIVNVTFQLLVSPSPQREKPHKHIYLKDEKYIERDSKPVAGLAKNFATENDFTRAAYQWLANNIEDAGYLAENKGAKFALEERLGDCTEHMYAFVALARANGIPARGVAGFVVRGEAAIAKSSSYHNWAEYYDGEKWVLVDSQKQIMDRDYQNYVAYRILGGDEGSETSASRFLAIDPRISIKL